MKIENGSLNFGGIKLQKGYSEIDITNLNETFKIKLSREYLDIKYFSIQSDLEQELNAELIFKNNLLMEIAFYVKQGFLEGNPFSHDYYQKESDFLKKYFFDSEIIGFSKVEYFDDFKTGSPFVIVVF